MGGWRGGRTYDSIYFHEIYVRIMTCQKQQVAAVVVAAAAALQTSLLGGEQGGVRKRSGVRTMYGCMFVGRYVIYVKCPAGCLMIYLADVHTYIHDLCLMKINIYSSI